MMILILLIIFILLAVFTGGDRTAKSIVTLAINALILFVSIGVMYLKVNPMLVATIACILVTLTTIFFQNEYNQKSKAAFISALIVIAIMLTLILFFVDKGHIQGMPVVGQNHIRESNGYEKAIGINMVLVEVAVILMTLVGAVIDMAIAVTSGIYEVVSLNPHLNRKELFGSGMKIGRDILSSTVNTLFFIFVGEYLLMFIVFMVYYSFTSMINSKEFVQGTITILISAAGCVLTIPISAFIASKKFKKKEVD